MSSPQQLLSTAKLTREAHAFVSDCVARFGLGATSRALSSSETTLERILGPGVQKATRDRLEERTRALMKPGDRARVQPPRVQLHGRLQLPGMRHRVRVPP